MNTEDRLLDESAEDLYENAPCGYLSTDLDGRIMKVNRTFADLVGRSQSDLLADTRFQDLLSPGARIYHETHFAPLLQMQGSVREIAVEFLRPDGSTLPALVNSVIKEDSAGRPKLIRVTVFDASGRRRYERELLKARQEQSEIALQLQQGLLTKIFPEMPGVEVEVAYRPARSGTEVGGDWYDAFHVPGGEIMLVVGDVVGRGVEAASEMGQLRSALRAFAATGLGPAELLKALDEYCQHFDVGRMATVVCARLNVRSKKLCYACAGHLAPLVMPPEGEPGYIWGGRSLPLATPMATGRQRKEAVCDLEPGSMIVLYTDGLVERRDQGFDPGMDLMLTEAAKHRDAEPAVFAGELIRALHDPSHVDDVCLLVARLDA